MKNLCRVYLTFNQLLTHRKPPEPHRADPLTIIHPIPMVANLALSSVSPELMNRVVE